jgi:hypothetical protein
LCILTPWGISLVGDSPYFYTLFPKIQTYAAGLVSKIRQLFKLSLQGFGLILKNATSY